MDINRKKQENTILFFANKNGGQINRLKLIKLIWLSDRLHLNRYGRLILNDKYMALPHGPAASNTLNLSQNRTDSYDVARHNILSKGEVDERFFSKSDIEIMEYVWNKFGTKSSSYLRNLSHQFNEWKRFEEQLNDPDQPNAYPMYMSDFFESPDLSNFPDSPDFSDIIDDATVRMSKEEFNTRNAFISYFK